MSENPLEGAAAGAFGTVTAEMIGELVLANSHKIAGDVVDRLEDEKIPLTRENIQNAVREELTHKTDFVKLLTSGVAFMTGQDVSTANFTAATAVDHNLSQMAFQITEGEVYDILKKEGIEITAGSIPAVSFEEALITELKEEGAKDTEGVLGQGNNSLFLDFSDLFSSRAVLTDAERFQSMQATTLYDRDPNVCNPRNFLIDEYEKVLLYSPKAYVGNIYPRVLQSSATLSNYSAAAECTAHDSINNRARWALQTQLLQYGINFGYSELNLRAANSAEFSYQIHESAFQFSNNVSTIRHFPWWLLTQYDVPEYGRIIGEWVYRPTSIFSGLGAGLSELARTQSYENANAAFTTVYNQEMNRKDSLGCRTINWTIETTNSPHGIDALPWYGRYFLRPLIDGASFVTSPLYK